MFPRPPLPPWATTNALRRSQIADEHAGRRVEHLRPGGNPQHDVLPAPTVLVLVGARLPDGAVLAPVPEVEQGRQPAVDDQNDAGPVATVAARRSPLGDELLATKRDRAVAAAAGAHTDCHLVDEVHGRGPRRRAGAARRRRAPRRC